MKDLRHLMLQIRKQSQNIAISKSRGHQPGHAGAEAGNQKHEQSSSDASSHKPKAEEAKYEMLAGARKSPASTVHITSDEASHKPASKVRILVKNQEIRSESRVDARQVGGLNKLGNNRHRSQEDSQRTHHAAVNTNKKCMTTMLPHGRIPCKSCSAKLRPSKSDQTFCGTDI